MPAFKENPFCSKFGVPADDNRDVDRLLNNLNQVKKSSSRDSYVCDDDSTDENFNHRVEFPRGNVTPTSSSLAKHVSEMILDGSKKLSRGSKIVKSS